MSAIRSSLLRSKLSHLGRRCFASLLLLTGGLGAEAVVAQGDERRQLTFEQPALRLSEALARFAAFTGLQLSYDPRLTQGLQAPALYGRFSEDAALTRLLADTGLAWSLTAERTLLLRPRPPAAPATTSTTVLPESVIVAQVQESATGPVSGYRATRSLTSTKTDTPLRDVPQAVQAVPRELIEDQQRVQLSDVLDNVSSVQRDNSHGGSAESFVIRGFHASNYAIDGMLTNPLGARTEVVRDLANIERVEVLKGPAAALYGQGNPGGLINLVTRRPSFVPTAELTAQAGSWDFYRLQTNVSGPLDDAGTLAGRLALAGQTDGGFRDTFRDARRTYLAPSLLWEPSATTRIEVGLEYTDTSSQFDRGVIPLNGKITLDRRTYLQEPWSHDEAEKLSTWLRLEHQVSDWLTLRHALRYEDAHKDRYVVDLRGVEGDGRTLRRLATRGEEDVSTLDAQFEAVANFTGAGIDHTVLAGLEYVEYDLFSRNERAPLATIDIFAPVYGAQPGRFAFNQAADFDVTIRSLYLQDQLALSEHWKVLAGVRYDSVEQRHEAIDRRFVVRHARQAPDALSPRLGLVYQPAAWLALYASYSRSFMPQTDLRRDGQPLDPESGRQYEIGAKLDVTTQLSATLALFEITREQVAATDPMETDYAVQTGEQRVRGVELDVAGQLLPGWKVVGNLSALDARLTRDSVYATGNRLQGVPRLSGALWSSYQLQQGRWRGLGVGAGLVFASGREGDIANSYDVSGYGRLDATLFYDVDDHLRLALTGRNLLDRHYLETVASTDGNYYGEPASLLASLTLRF